MFEGIFGKKGTPVSHLDIKLYNTETNTLEIFKPLKSPKVTIYSCGPTVYDYAHLGNLRSYVFSDLLKRTLIKNGYDVKHTINFTDFGHLSDDNDAGEDKMMRGLKKEGLPFTLENMRQLSDKYIEAFRKDIAALRILEPTDWARASDYVKKQISFIKSLDDKGYTYETSDGVYFDISKFPTYGRLGSIDISKLKAVGRIEVNKEKRHPADFAVWKKSSKGWKSRFGAGFPGWHIECSTMAMATLGKQIDIHTGGIDHIPVHHNAEIAQSEALTGKKFVKYWMHNAFLTIDNTKIAKSLGNGITLRHLQDRGFSGDDYRYWLLTAHYRSPVNFSWEALTAAKQALFRLKRHMYEDYKRQVSFPDQTYLNRFHETMANDLDTPAAVAILWEVIKDEKIDKKTKAGTISSMDEILQIGLSATEAEGVRSLGVISNSDIPDDIQTLINERETARTEKNWAKADELRDTLKEKGYTLEDSAGGPKLTKNN